MDVPAQPAPIAPFARDEDLIEGVRADGVPRWRVYPWPGETLVLGRGSRADREVHLERCRADGIELRRRRGGGCAVLLDRGNAVVSAVFPLPGMGRIDRAWRIGLDWLRAGLAGAGCPGIRVRGISDLARDDRKVGGSCLYRARDLVFFTASLLVRADPERIERYLKHPPREPGYRAGRSHRDFVTSLGGPEATAAGLARDLARSLAETAPEIPGFSAWDEAILVPDDPRGMPV